MTTYILQAVALILMILASVLAWFCVMAGNYPLAILNFVVFGFNALLFKVQGDARKNLEAPEFEDSRWD